MNLEIGVDLNVREGSFEVVIENIKLSTEDSEYQQSSSYSTYIHVPPRHPPLPQFLSSDRRPSANPHTIASKRTFALVNIHVLSQRRQPLLVSRKVKPAVQNGSRVSCLNETAAYQRVWDVVLGRDETGASGRDTVDFFGCLGL